jgi:hypothetical protein
LTSENGVRPEPNVEPGRANWNFFVRALVAELGVRDDAGARDALLCTIGRRIAQLLPVPEVASMEALELEINTLLDELHWGQARLVLNETERCVVITHSGGPRLGSGGEPRGYWFGAVLQGLYDGWFASQAGADPSLKAHRQPGSSSGCVVFRYSR